MRFTLRMKMYRDRFYIESEFGGSKCVSKWHSDITRVNAPSLGRARCSICKSDFLSIFFFFFLQKSVKQSAAKSSGPERSFVEIERAPFRGMEVV